MANYLDATPGDPQPIALRPTPNARRPVILAPAGGGDSPAALSAQIGRETADLACILFMLPMLARVRSMFEAEIHDEVAGLFSDATDFDPAECQQCQGIAWLAFDRRLALHTRNQLHAGRA